MRLTGDALVSLQIRNFQSLKSVDLEFGPFTVLVGPSSTGKSSVLRAVRAVARNVNSPSAVSHGQTSFNVTAQFGDCSVAVERGKAKSLYVLDGEEYPKAGVKVPTAVANKLRMPVSQDMELYLADQFDRPFLLAETGSQAAKVLGELTNASLLMESAREANLRRQRHNQVAKLRARDVEAIHSRVKEFMDLPMQKAKLEACRKTMNTARDLAGRIGILEAAISRVKSAQQRIEAMQSALSEVPDVKDELLQAETSLQSILDLSNLMMNVRSRVSEYETAKSFVKSAKLASDALVQEHEQVLVEMGVCPVCGQSTGSL